MYVFVLLTLLFFCFSTQQDINHVYYESEYRTEWCRTNSTFVPCFLFARKFSRGAAMRLLSEGVVGPFDASALLATTPWSVKVSDMFPRSSLTINWPTANYSWDSKCGGHTWHTVRHTERYSRVEYCDNSGSLINFGKSELEDQLHHGALISLLWTYSCSGVSPYNFMTVANLILTYFVRLGAYPIFYVYGDWGCKNGIFFKF